MLKPTLLQESRKLFLSTNHGSSLFNEFLIEQSGGEVIPQNTDYDLTEAAIASLKQTYDKSSS